MITRGFITDRIITRGFGTSEWFGDVIEFVLYINRTRKFNLER